MDPVTHTFAGAALGRAGLARTTPMAMVALIVGANVPDVDILASFGGPDVSLGFRRGWTHGPLGLLLLPLVLVVMIWAWRRFTAREDDPPVRYGRLTALAYGAALTHPVLDWLNTYGMRFLMPFSDTWYYGDALFIVDPWIWLMLAYPIMLATTASVRGKTWWTLGGVLASALMVLSPFVPISARVAWVVGVGAVVTLRYRRFGHKDPGRIGRVAVGTALAYAMFMFVGSTIARRQIAAIDNMPLTSVVMAGPVPADPFRREVIVRHGDAYTVHIVNWILGGRAAVPPETIPILYGPEAHAAMAAPNLAGYANWVRLPTFRVSETTEGYRVDIVDQRYARPGGFGAATVLLTRELRPVGVEVN